MNKATNLDLRISQLSPGIRISNSAEDPGKGGADVFREHLYCPVWTLPDWPYECPAKHQLGFTNDVVMACLNHNIWWHMSPPSTAFNYSLPPLLTPPADDDTTQEDNDKAARLYRAIRQAIYNHDYSYSHKPGSPQATDALNRFGFLNDVIAMGIESGQVGAWMDVEFYDPGSEERLRKAQATLKIADGYQTDDTPPDNPLLTVDHKLIEAALAKLRSQTRKPEDNPYLYADVHSDAGVLDAVDAVNLIEIALFGEVRYA